MGSEIYLTTAGLEAKDDRQLISGEEKKEVFMKLLNIKGVYQTLVCVYFWMGMAHVLES